MHQLSNNNYLPFINFLSSDPILNIKLFKFCSFVRLFFILFLGRDSLWPILLILTCIPCLVSCALLPKCPESPRYLMEIKEEAAETALKELRGSDDVSADKEHLKSYTERWSVRKLLGAHQLRWLVILLSSLALCQQLSGINVVRPLFFFTLDFLLMFLFTFRSFAAKKKK